MKKVVSLFLETNLFKRNNSTMKTHLNTSALSKLNNNKHSLNTSSFNSLSIKLNKYFHNNLCTNFFDFFNTQQPIESVIEYSYEETKKITEKLQYMEYLYKELEIQLRIEYSNFVKTGEIMSPELFKMMIYILEYFFAVIEPKESSDPKESKLFYTSSIGLKIWDIVAKVKLLLVKSIIQEWFIMDVYMEKLRRLEYIPGELENDRIYFSRTFDMCLMNSTVTPSIPMSSFVPYTREILISSIYVIIYHLKGGQMGDGFVNYMKEIVREYPIIKERYLNAKIVEDKYQMIYEQDKEFTFLEKKYSEHEFDWFEDLETNLPLNLNSLIKLIEAYLYFPQDINRFNELLDESLRIDPNNFYTLFIKANYARFTPINDDKVTELAIEVKELCERGLEILKEAKPLPLREEIKLEEGEVLPERKNDLKLNSFHYEIATANIVLAGAPGLANDIRHSYAKKAIEEFQLVELFTRFPLDGNYYFLKGNAFLGLEMYEQAVRCYQYVDKYSSKLPKETVIDAIANFCNCLVAMGYSQMCLEELDKYIEQYEGDIRLRLEKLYVEEALCKSKAELAIVKEKYINMVAELSNPNFKTTDENILYVPRWLGNAKVRIAELESIISDPLVAESW
ncbi:hypothetical protein ABK040_003534 [Willaertia magna]